MNYVESVELSILKDYESTIWKPFLQAVEQYELINEGDKIAVCISGGKDSMLMAKLLQIYQKLGLKNFELVFLVMDPGYNPVNRNKIEENAKKLGIPIDVFESNIFDVANETEKSPCYLCARMRRGHLYANAKQRGCNKIALGHHFSDVIETTLIGMFYGSQLQAMLPKLHSTNFEGMELIRPMYCIHEDDIISWCKNNNLSFIQCACRFTEKNAQTLDGIGESKRQEIKLMIKKLSEQYPNVEQSIFDSIHNLKLDTMPKYKTNSKEIENY